MIETSTQPRPMTHFGDPCIHCGTPHDDVAVGACRGDAAKAKPIGYCLLERRWDGYERFGVRFSDSRIETLWTHPSFRAPYYHFGFSKELVQPPRYDPRIKADLTSTTPEGK